MSFIIKLMRFIPKIKKFSLKLSKKNLAAGLAFLNLVGAGYLAFQEIPTFINLSGNGKTFQQVITSSGISPEPSFGGVAWRDFDGDGDLDLFLSTRTKNTLYRNDRGKFTDVTEAAGIKQLTPPMYSTAFGDYDNDGCPDLYLSMHGQIDTLETPGRPDVLYRNNCDGTFNDVAEQAGISDLAHGTGVTWVDYDNDGWLDIYVANGGIWKDDLWTYESNILYRNSGNGTFTDVTKKAGVEGLAKCSRVSPFPRYPKEKGITEKDRPLGGWKESFQPIWFDYNSDGHQDVYISNDYGVSTLYKNNGNGTFTDTTEAAGMCVRGSGMGITVGDYDNDGDIDIYITHGDRNLFWRNNGNETFSEISEENGTANFGSLGWGTSFVDFDNDGDLDLHAVNGTVLQANIRERFVHRADRFFENDGNGNFTDIANSLGFTGNDPKLASALADYNEDGFVDIFVVADYFRKTGDYSTNRLYRNTPNGNNYLTVELIGTRSNRDAVGARIILKSGGKTQIREVISGSSFIAQDSLRQTFGLGKNKEISEIEIRWPSGIKQILKNVKPNQKIIITETP